MITLIIGAFAAVLAAVFFVWLLDGIISLFRPCKSFRSHHVTDAEAWSIQRRIDKQLQ
jgi:hypothetical protein